MWLIRMRASDWTMATDSLPLISVGTQITPRPLLKHQGKATQQAQQGYPTSPTSPASFFKVSEEDFQLWRSAHSWLGRRNRDPQLSDRVPTKTNRKFLNWSFSCQGGNGEECWDQMVQPRPQKQAEKRGRSSKSWRRKKESHVMVGPSEGIRWENLLTLKKNSSVH